jgi:DNA-binding LacI/PurR family transcriptional regulator
VAKAAGVSKSTVSNVMHGTGRFTPATAAEVTKAIKRLGFRPNVHARQLVQQKSTTLGVVVGALDNPIYAELVMQFELEAAKHGFHAMFCNTQGEEAAEVAGLGNYLDNRAAGILFVTHPPEWKRARRMIEGRIPMVFVTCESDWGDVVRCDDETGGRIATQHLVDLGHRRIAYFSDPVDDAANRDRELGYKKVMERSGLRPTLVTWHRDDKNQRDSQVEAAIRSGVTAIFTTDDYGAIELLDVADRLGMSVPRDLSVVGFDDLIMSGLARIGLTTVRQPKKLLAEIAVSTLLDRINGRGAMPRVRKRVDVELVIRGSTGQAPRR